MTFTLVARWLKTVGESRHLNSGQAIVLIGAASIGLIAMMGLAIDGGRLLFLQRDTQNAADAAAIAAARALCTARNPEPYALAAAAENGFDNNGEDNWITVSSPPNSASFPIAEECEGCYVEVDIKAKIPPSFIGIVYGGELAATGHTIGACNPDMNPPETETSDLRAVWAMQECSPNGVTITGSDIYIEGGLHSNGSMKIEPHSGGGTVIGPTSVVDPKSEDEIVQGEDKINWGTGGPGDDDGTGSTSTGVCLSTCFTSATGTGDDDTYPGTNPYVTQPKTEYPVDYTIADFQLPSGKYAAKALAANQYYEYPCSSKGGGGGGKGKGGGGGGGGNVDFWSWVEAYHMTGSSMDNGIYYAACDIDIKQNNKADNVTGNVTIVSTGTIQVHGNGQQWEPYEGVGDLLMYANAADGCTGQGAVKFSGSNNTWNGIIFAPGGSIKMSASSNNSSAGCLVGLSVELSGSSNRIICDLGTLGEHDPMPGIWLSE